MPAEDVPLFGSVSDHARRAESHVCAASVLYDGSRPVVAAKATADRLRMARDAIDAAERELAVTLRAAGQTWSQVGDAFGVTKQAAQQRFGG